MAGGGVMRGRWVIAAFLSALLLFGRAASALAGPSPASGPEWTPLRGANPALVAFAAPAADGEGGLVFDFLTPEPLDVTYTAFAAVPDTGYGAAALTATLSRTYWTGATDEARTYAYAWGRRWGERWAAGASVRSEQRQTSLDDGWVTPREQGLGFDLGALYRPEERTWAGLALHDVFDTTLTAPGGASLILPRNLHLSMGRQVNPALRLTLEGRDVTGATVAGASWQVGATLSRGRFAWRAAAATGTTPAWSAGVRTGLGAYRLDLTVNGTDTRLGGALGVTALW